MCAPNSDLDVLIVEDSIFHLPEEWLFAGIAVARWTLGGHMAKKPSRRELINTGTDKRYVRRDEKGQFKESDDVGRSLTADRRQHAKTKAPKGQGDRGDR